MRSRLVGASVAFGICVTPATADQCLSQYTDFNLCEFAENAQAELAPMLPMRLNANLTLSRVLAIGRQIVMYGTWTQTEKELRERLRAAGMTNNQLVDSMRTMSHAMVCGQDRTAAFVQMGGSISYHYTTADAVPVTMVTIDLCPSS